MKTLAILLCLAAAAHAQLAVMHTNGTIVSPTNVAALRASIGVPSTFGTGSNSIVGGGLSNQATGIYSVVGGGQSNTASGVEVIIDGTSYGVGGGTVAGGFRNTAAGLSSFVGGGSGNNATGWSSVISGGNNNRTTNSFSAIGGGLLNTNTGYIATIAGGILNAATGDYAAIGGGGNNSNGAYMGAIGGGQGNTASGFFNNIGGGEYNTNTGNRSVIPGGTYNNASANNSFAAGSYANASHEGAFVWSDNSSTNSFSSTNNNSYNIRAHGGLSLDLGTNGLSARGTNPLLLGNAVSLRGANNSNVPAIYWQTADQKGNGSLFSVSHAWDTNSWDSPTNAHTNWSILFLGQNIAPNANQNNVGHPVQSMGSSYLTFENNYNYAGIPNNPASETYFVTRDTNNVLVRTLEILGSQTNAALGVANYNYPLAIVPAAGTIGVQDGLWATAPLRVVYSHPSIGGMPHVFVHNPDTNNSRDVRFNMKLGDDSEMILSLEKAKYFLFRGNYGYAFIATTNGIVVGSSGDLAPAERVHLAGNTRIDGAITFNSPTNAAVTRTNLGLGGGITTNVSSGTLQFSNGILVGHTP